MNRMRDSIYVITDVYVYDTCCPWTHSLFSHPTDQVPVVKRLFKILKCRLLQSLPELAPRAKDAIGPLTPRKSSLTR